MNLTIKTATRTSRPATARRGLPRALGRGALRPLGGARALPGTGRVSRKAEKCSAKSSASRNGRWDQTAAATTGHRSTTFPNTSTNSPKSMEFTVPMSMARRRGGGGCPLRERVTPACVGRTHELCFMRGLCNAQTQATVPDPGRAGPCVPNASNRTAPRSQPRGGGGGRGGRCHSQHSFKPHRALVSRTF